MSDTTRDELATKAKFEIVWAKLRELEINAVKVCFSGSGDSGQIDDVYVVVSMPEPYDHQELANKETRENDLLSQASVNLLEPTQTRLVKLIEELSSPLISRYEDWWDNDGGNGELLWHADESPPRLDLEINVAVVEYETHDHELDRYGEDIE